MRPSHFGKKGARQHAVAWGQSGPGTHILRGGWGSLRKKVRESGGGGK